MYRKIGLCLINYPLLIAETNNTVKDTKYSKSQSKLKNDRFIFHTLVDVCFRVCNENIRHDSNT